MNAYTLVDSQTRKKLDEMLKTWKEPVPGSLDPRPVFPVEITRNIENALIKARTAALQQQQARQQQELRSRPRSVATPPPAWKGSSTPTPAPYTASGQLANGQNPVSNLVAAGCCNRLLLTIRQSYQMRNPQATPLPQALTQGNQYGQSVSDFVDLDSLYRDIERLISSAQTDFANNPVDTSIRQRLKALLDLQSILQQQKLPQEQLKLIRDQVSKLSATAPARVATVIPAPPSLPIPLIPTPTISTPPVPTLTTHTPQPNLQALLNPSTLAELIKATANSQNRTPPPPQPLPPQVSISTSNTPTTSTPVGPENPLIASLRARGLLPPVLGTPAQQPPTLPFILPSQNGYPPTATPQIQPSISVNVQMSTSSIKM